MPFSTTWTYEISPLATRKSANNWQTNRIAASQIECFAAWAVSAASEGATEPKGGRLVLIVWASGPGGQFHQHLDGDNFKISYAMPTADCQGLHACVRPSDSQK